jgi:predicted Fe-S protein YdhL (DUF1289 family)
VVVDQSPAPEVFDDSLDARWARASKLQPQGVPSPCVGVCTMATPIRGSQLPSTCAGCWRTLPEIAKWGQFSDDEKRQLWAELRRREAAQFSA